MSVAQQLTVGDTWASTVNKILKTTNDITRFQPLASSSDASGAYSKRISGVQRVTVQQLVDVATTLNLSELSVIGDAKVGFALDLSKKRESAWLHYIKNHPILLISVVILLLALGPLFLFNPFASPPPVVQTTTRSSARTDADTPHKYRPPVVDPLQIVIPN